MKKIILSSLTLLFIFAVSCNSAYFKKKSKLPAKIKYYQKDKVATVDYHNMLFFYQPNKCTSYAKQIDNLKLLKKKVNLIGEIEAEKCPNRKQITYIVGEIQGYGYIFLPKESVKALEKFKEQTK